MAVGVWLIAPAPHYQPSPTNLRPRYAANIRTGTPESIVVIHSEAAHTIISQIEANIVNKDYTVNMHEWHDVTADMSRTDLYSQRSGGTNSNIYDYADNLYFHVREDGIPRVQSVDT
jgi:hypothetical protein